MHPELSALLMQERQMEIQRRGHRRQDASRHHAVGWILHMIRVLVTSPLIPVHRVSKWTRREVPTSYIRFARVSRSALQPDRGIHIRNRVPEGGG